jgi:hypothetical protein
MTASAHYAAARLNLRPTLWTSWGEDWTAHATPDSVFGEVTKDLHGGGTILLHDSDCTAAPLAWTSTLRALPWLFDHCEERGLAVGPLREHSRVGTRRAAEGVTGDSPGDSSDGGSNGGPQCPEPSSAA